MTVQCIGGAYARTCEEDGTGVERLHVITVYYAQYCFRGLLSELSSSSEEQKCYAHVATDLPDHSFVAIKKTC